MIVKLDVGDVSLGIARFVTPTFESSTRRSQKRYAVTTAARCTHIVLASERSREGERSRHWPIYDEKKRADKVVETPL